MNQEIPQDTPTTEKKEKLKSLLQSNLQAIEDGTYDIQDVSYICKQLLYKARSLNKNPDKQYLGYKEGHDAYTKILETGITAEEALQFVAEHYGKSKDWVDEIKNNNYFHSKTVVEAHDHHPVQKQMVKNGTMDRTLLRKATTPNQQLRTLYKQRKLHTTLTSLQSEVSSLREDNGSMKAQVISTKVDLDKVKKDLNIEGLTDLQKAIELKKAGLTYEQIAKHLGKGLRTIKRWLLET